MKKNILSVLFLFLSAAGGLILILNLTSCSTTEPPSNQTLALKLEDVSCTEAWIQLTTNNIQLPATINLLKNNTVSQVINLNTQDSLLYIDSLLPDQNYSFQVSSIQSAAGGPASSNELSVRTMDTTSHNFTWQTFTFGDAGAGSSTLYDVAIIDENNIWAVGEIYMNDSLGQPDPTCYNAVHWDGSNFELKRIKTNACGGVDYPPIKAIFAFSSNEILFAHIDGSISRFNGIEFTNDCSLITQLDGSANKIWGNSSNDFYVASGNGFIAHFQNKSWIKIESVTDLEIQHIWGVINTENAQQEIFCIASDKYQSIDRKVYCIINNNATEISNEGLPWSLSSIWFNNKHKCYIVGDGIFTKDLSSSNSWQDITLGITPYYTHAIRGTGLNDIVVGGSFGELLHFNGISWKSYISQTMLQAGNFKGLAIKGNLIIAVGINNPKAVITVGRRTN